ncbi:MAG: phosphate/phosphite/phosphonate ABC transporter substrate-binding protein [Hyphomicrobiaceae bacterium]
MSPALIANARMYAVAPGATAAWNRLFAWLQQTSGVSLTVVDHAFPAPLNDLWRRDDLACTFMCGWPFLRLGAQHNVIAAPVPAAGYAAGRPVYCSHFIVKATSPFETLEDTFGHRFAYTIEDSHSGYNAPRHHLMRYREQPGQKLFGEVVGPLTTPRRVLEAIIEGRADVGPQDSFAFDLMRRHLPELASQVRVVASSDIMPIPAFMASAGTSADIVERLRAALLSIKDSPELAPVCADLCITGFATLVPEAYDLSEVWAQDAERRGLATIT